MHVNARARTTLAIAIIAVGCASVVAASDGKIPVTTKSDDAKEAYMKGRALFDELRGTDARQHFQRAAELDPNFALAHLGLANTAATGPDFWQALEAAVASVDHASDGERMQILAVAAGIGNEPVKQGELLRAMVETYPNDERGHNALGNYHFGRQEYTEAIAHYKKANAIDASFSQPYNQLGYALRFTGDYDGAKQAFEKYIDLIPNSPNPYDSYAELLMKTGEFEESIKHYQKALEKNETFIPSWVGIGHNYLLMGDYAQARKAFGNLAAQARTIAEERQALFWKAMSYVYEGNHEAALAHMQERYALVVNDHDTGAMAGDLNQIGTLLLEAGHLDQAQLYFDRAVGVAARADIPQANKIGNARNHLYNSGRVAIARGDIDGARALGELYLERATELEIPGEIRAAHHLLGRIDVEAESFEGALKHLAQANQQDPRVLYLTGMAYQGTGDAAKAQASFESTAHLNELNPNLAYVRARAVAELGESSSSL